MDRPLVGRSILIVEDEPLIAMDIRREFEAAGALVVLKRSLQSALVAVDDDAPSAAILDHALGNDDSSSLCERLNERDIPFVVHSGCSNLEGACSAGVAVGKPNHPQLLVTTVVGLLRSRPISSVHVPSHCAGGRTGQPSLTNAVTAEIDRICTRLRKS